VAPQQPSALQRTVQTQQPCNSRSRSRCAVCSQDTPPLCQPSCPVGSNENINGLIRQYLPKGTDLSVHSQEELDAIAFQLNMRPRKRFDFKCPIEVMSEVMQKGRSQ